MCTHTRMMSLLPSFAEFRYHQYRHSSRHHSYDRYPHHRIEGIMNRPRPTHEDNDNESSTATSDFLSALLADLGDDVRDRIVLVPDNARPRPVPKGIFSPAPQVRHETQRWSSTGSCSSPGDGNVTRPRNEHSPESPRRAPPDDEDKNYMLEYTKYKQQKQLVEAKGQSNLGMKCLDDVDRKQNDHR